MWRVSSAQCSRCCHRNGWLCVSILCYRNDPCLYLLSVPWIEYGAGHSCRTSPCGHCNDCISGYLTVDYGTLRTENASECLASLDLIAAIIFVIGIIVLRKWKPNPLWLWQVRDLQEYHVFTCIREEAQL